MPGRKEKFQTWDALWEHVDAFSSALGRSKTHNINSTGLRQQARELVMEYFGETKTALSGIGVSAATLQRLDSEMQHLIGLATGRNSKTSYQKTLREIRSCRKEVETGLEFLIGAGPTVAAPPMQVGNVEAAILATLESMLPASGGSYRQALFDIQDTRRISYRGTAAEIREVVREVLDHLAPDEEVMKSQGFKLEKDQTGPTMKQKVRFILRARKVGDSARSTAESSVGHLENVASVGRAVYTRGSTAVHTPRAREEVLNFKLYADAVLGELLSIHNQAAPAATNQVAESPVAAFATGFRIDQTS